MNCESYLGVKLTRQGGGSGAFQTPGSEEGGAFPRWERGEQNKERGQEGSCDLNERAHLSPLWELLSEEFCRDKSVSGPKNPPPP